jgi:hypothetical protein
MPKNLKKTENNYGSILTNVAELLEQARRLSARSVNAIMTATYWEIGRRIVEFEQDGEERAEYGQALLKKLSKDLTDKFGRGFSRQNLQQMRAFYIFRQTCQTVSGKFVELSSISSKLSARLSKKIVINVCRLVV